MPPNQATGLLNTAPDPILTAAAPAAPAADPKAGMLSDWYGSYMSSTPKTANATAAQAGTTAWTPGDDASVQGQLTGILDKGGPLMDRATTRAAQQMNSRGLLNSSMAVTAGQSALYDAAMPIAQQDAQTKANAGQFNANASNTAALTNAGLATDVNRFNAGEVNEATTAQNAAGVGSFQQQQQIQGQKEMQQAGFAQQNVMQATEIENQRWLQTTQQDFTSRMQALQEQGMDARQAQQLASSEALQKMAEAGVQNRFDAQQALQSSQFSFEQAAIDRRTAENHSRELERLGYINTLNNKNVPSQYAAAVSSTTMASVNAILGDPNLEPAAKKIAVQNVIDYANSTLDWAAKFYETALPPIVAPGAAVPTGPVMVGTPGTSAPVTVAPGSAPRATIPRQGGYRGNEAFEL